MSFSVIGGFNNTRTLVRHGKKILRDFRTSNVLSTEEPVQFRIEIIPSEHKIKIMRSSVTASFFFYFFFLVSHTLSRSEIEFVFIFLVFVCACVRAMLYMLSTVLVYYIDMILVGSLGGVIQIYRDNVLLLETVDRNVAPVRYFNYATDDHLNGMNFYYDCKHDVESVQSSSPQIFTADARVKMLAMTVLCIQLTLFRWR